MGANDLLPDLADAARVEDAARGSDAGAVDDAGKPAEDIYNRIGTLTRTLHDSLRELGYDKNLKDVRANLPDARDRLAFIQRVTGEAAEKVLNAVDNARKLQDDMSFQATDLIKRWQAVAAFTGNGSAAVTGNSAGTGAGTGTGTGTVNDTGASTGTSTIPGTGTATVTGNGSVTSTGTGRRSGRRVPRATPAGEELVNATCAFLTGISNQAEQTNTVLTEIMMAQDFHDLTGQVIRKVVALAHTVEEQLLNLLIETAPVEQRPKVEAPRVLEGPVVNAEGRSDVLVDQEGVDDLLASLGF